MTQYVAKPNLNNDIGKKTFSSESEAISYLEEYTGYEMSFSEAFRNARKLKGPGQIFVWNGKHYTTDYYYELVISVGDQVTEVNYDEKTYKTEERLSETIAVRSYKDSDQKLITYTYLNNL